MHAFFEFFIERLLWLWQPLYGFYRVLRDMVEAHEEKVEKKKV